MSGTFTLLDLPSQAIAVQRILTGKREQEKLSWLSSQGEVSPGPFGGSRQTYWFVSLSGHECAFFFDNDEIVFLGDHTTYVVKEQDRA